MVGIGKQSRRNNKYFIKLPKNRDWQIIRYKFVAHYSHFISSLVLTLKKEMACRISEVRFPVVRYHNRGEHIRNSLISIPKGMPIPAGQD